MENRKLSDRLALPYALAGAVCLIGAAVLCWGLGRGGWLDRLAVAAAFLALAALALLLLRWEGYDRKTLLVLLLPVGAAMLVRVLCMDYASTDYNSFLSGWYLFFRQEGGFAAIRHSIGDYNMPYLYFMALISYIPVPDLYLIKLFSIFFDVLLAWGGLRLVRVLVGKQSDRAPLAAFCVLLFLPTVVLNGAYWGQCDVIYAALTVHALALVLEGKNKTSLAVLAVAFSFKLQTIFLVPLWGVLWLAKRVKFRELWVFPLAYVVTIIPAFLLGKPLKDIVGIYFNQAGQYPRLTLNAPSVFQYVAYGTESGQGIYEYLGIAGAALLVLILMGAGLWLGRRLNDRAVMAVAVVMAIGVPFFLPHMHERYFFLADVLTVCWACANLRRIPIAALVQAASLASYRVFLRLKFNYTFAIGETRYGMPIEATVMLAALVLAAVACVRQLREAAGAGGEELT